MFGNKKLKEEIEDLRIELRSLRQSIAAIVDSMNNTKQDFRDDIHQRFSAVEVRLRPLIYIQRLCNELIKERQKFQIKDIVEGSRPGSVFSRFRGTITQIIHYPDTLSYQYRITDSDGNDIIAQEHEINKKLGSAICKIRSKNVRKKANRSTQ